MITNIRVNKILLLISGLFMALLALWLSGCTPTGPPRVLVFSKTTGYRHIEAIEAGKLALLKMGKEHGLAIDTTENAAAFSEANLKQYQAIVFLNVSGELFNQEQRISLQRYIQAGGGFLAIHAAADAERNWPWYGRLVGAYFDSHPPIQKATFKTIEKNHPTAAFLPATFARTDEHYNFQQVSPDIKVLITIDEETYEGGTMGDRHPVVWYQEYDGGRSFYTAMGHTKETYSEPLFLKQVWEGLHWVTGGDSPKPLDYTQATPEENRFKINVLLSKLDEPMQMAIAGDGRVYFAERRGNIQCYDPVMKQSKVVGTIPVTSRYEDGLLGLALDPDFKTNRWMYVFYSIPNGLAFRISRFTLDAKGLVNYDSEKPLIQIPKQILDGSHTGGGLLFDPRGTGDLYIAVGDNSSPRGWGYAPIDERPDRKVWDAQRTSANTNDLRGKILRIHPEPDGTYTIPKGNLFPEGTPKTRPEIYSMGHRQPWRMSIDTKTGWLYLSEVGPDSRKDSVGIGPAAQDEFNQIRGPGNYGWPYFVGDNKAYWDYDFATGKSGKKYEAAKPVNHSPNNTGLNELPPAKSALIWYPYAVSEKFPLMGSGGRSATGGPFFRKDAFKNAKNPFPDYYEGKWFIADWMRGWVMVVSLDEAGNYKSMERFMPSQKFANPIDLKFGPDGSLYILEYGTGWFLANDNARLIRIDYNPGNRAPIVQASAAKLAGAVPLTVKLSSKGSYDYDADALQYTWKISPKAGSVLKTFTEANPTFTLTEPGIYTATLTVTDALGATNSKSLEIKAGNEAPVVSINITEGNKTFVFPDKKIAYSVNVSDKEDGSLAAGSIPAGRVSVTIDYYAGIGQPHILGHQGEPEHSPGTTRALNLINGSDCYGCHGIEKKSIGPSFKQVAERYKNDADAGTKLVKKIINGGSGAWGEVAMSAHPGMKPEDAKKIVDFILGLSNAPVAENNRPAKGTFTTIPTADQGKGGYIIQASYTDKGANGVPPIRSEETIILRLPRLLPAQASVSKSIMHVKTVNPAGEVSLFTGKYAYLGFQKIDFTGISKIQIAGTGKTPVEIRLDSPTGLLVGKTEPVVANKQKTAKGDKKPSVFKVKVNGVKGVHDLYLVVRDNAATRSQVLFKLRNINFLPEEHTTLPTASK